MNLKLDENIIKENLSIRSFSVENHKGLHQTYVSEILNENVLSTSEDRFVTEDNKARSLDYEFILITIKATDNRTILKCVR